MKKKIWILVASVIAVVLIAGGILYFNQSSGIKVKIGKSDEYSKSEIKDAVKVVQEEFKKEFKGVELKEIEFDNALNLKEEGRAKKEYGKKYALVLTSTLKSGSSEECGAFEPNTVYTGWNWTLVRDSQNEEWKLVSWGEA